MGKIVTTCPEGHVTTSRCRCPGNEVTQRRSTGCGTYCSKEFPAHSTGVVSVYHGKTIEEILIDFVEVRGDWKTPAGHRQLVKALLESAEAQQHLSDMAPRAG